MGETLLWHPYHPKTVHLHLQGPDQLRCAASAQHGSKHERNHWNFQGIDLKSRFEICIWTYPTKNTVSHIIVPTGRTFGLAMPSAVSLGLLLILQLASKHMQTWFDQTKSADGAIDFFQANNNIILQNWYHRLLRHFLGLMHRALVLSLGPSMGKLRSWIFLSTYIRILSQVVFH